jgi:uncharacterized cupredoxin-like copper-binding protein
MGQWLHPSDRRPALGAIAVVAILALGACGGGGGVDKGTPDQPRAVSIIMRDNDFSEPLIGVSVGETVTFTFKNNGKLVHEAFIGNAAAQTARGTAAEAGPEPQNGVLVAVGQVGTLTYTFTTPGSLVLGCHLPGHYEAGMHASIRVN